MTFCLCRDVILNMDFFFFDKISSIVPAILHDLSLSLMHSNLKFSFLNNNKNKIKNNQRLAIFKLNLNVIFWSWLFSSNFSYSISLLQISIKWDRFLYFKLLNLGKTKLFSLQRTNVCLLVFFFCKILFIIHKSFTFNLKFRV